MNWKKGTFVILGVKFTTNLIEMTRLNYKSKTEEIKRLFNNWSERILTPFGKIAVINSLATSKVHHIIAALPNPEADIRKSLKQTLFKYLWKNSPDKVKRSIITQDY